MLGALSKASVGMRAGATVEARARGVLQRGMAGGAVRELQRQLVQNGFLSPAHVATGPGIYGPRTEQGVIAFQKAAGLPPTGVAGPTTRDKLRTYQDGFVRGADVPTEPVQGTKPWEPANFSLSSSPNARHREGYQRVIDQFSVERNGRYVPRAGIDVGLTFAADVGEAMGVHVPVKAGTRWLDAHGLHSLLETQGEALGFRSTTAVEAQSWANRGGYALATSGDGEGQVAVIRPGQLTSKGPAIAQAGPISFSAGHLTDGFGERPAHYWVHA